MEDDRNEKKAKLFKQSRELLSKITFLNNIVAWYHVKSGDWILGDFENAPNHLKEIMKDIQQLQTNYGECLDEYLELRRQCYVETNS